MFFIRFIEMKNEGHWFIMVIIKNSNLLVIK